jgi:hypothetical protein
MGKYDWRKALSRRWNPEVSKRELIPTKAEMRKMSTEALRQRFVEIRRLTEWEHFSELEWSRIDRVKAAIAARCAG